MVKINNEEGDHVKTSVHQKDLMNDEWNMGRVVMAIILLLAMIATSIYFFVTHSDKTSDLSAIEQPVVTKKSKVIEVIDPVTQRKEIIYENEVKEILSPEEVYSYNQPRDMAKVIGEKINKPLLASTNKTQQTHDSDSLTESNNPANSAPIISEKKEDISTPKLAIEQTLTLNNDQQEVMTHVANKPSTTEVENNQSIEIVASHHTAPLSEAKIPALAIETALTGNPLVSDNSTSPSLLKDPVPPTQKQTISTVPDTKTPIITHSAPLIEKIEKPIENNNIISDTVKTILPVDQMSTNNQENPSVAVINIPATTMIPPVPSVKKPIIATDKISLSTLDTKTSTGILPQVEILKPIINKTKPVSNGRVTKILMTTGLIDREPIDKVTQPITINHVDEVNLYFFTKIMRMTGQTLYHQWFWQDQMVYEKPIEVKARRWRATTSKVIAYSQPGQWTAKILNAEREVLKEIKFMIVQE